MSGRSRVVVASSATGRGHDVGSRSVSESKLARARRIRSNLGTRCAVKFVALRVFGALSRRGRWRLHPRATMHPVVGRSGTSDLDVFGQIFSGDEYGCVRDLADVTLIVDGGANVGYSAAYFLSAYPHATVVSVEPDAENVAVLRANLKPYGDRSVVVEAALWPVGETLEIIAGFRDGRHWSRQVRRPNGTSAHRVRGTTVEAVMELAGATHVSIMKLDIEGAEAELFRTGYEAWIDRIDTFVVELHDDGGFGPATARFESALASLSPRYLVSGELTVAHVRPPRPSPLHSG